MTRLVAAINQNCWKKVIAFERKRRDEEEKRLRQISETNREIAALVDNKDEARCLAWLDSNPKIFEQRSNFKRLGRHYWACKLALGFAQEGWDVVLLFGHADVQIGLEGSGSRVPHGLVG